MYRSKDTMYLYNIFVGDFNFHYDYLISPHFGFKSLITYLSLKLHVL